MRCHALLLFISGAVMLGCFGCAQTATPKVDLPVATPSVAPTQGDDLPMTQSAPGLQGLIGAAKSDLAKRLSVSTVEIDVIEAGPVTWPNSSLGCPQEGMAYAEVLTPGYRIVLEVTGRQYEYHAGRGMETFYCPNPTPPVPGDM